MNGTNKIENVVLVSIDNLRKDGLGCYGSPFQTPTIDELASRGVKFNNCMASANSTTPSHASMLTSMHPFKHQARMNGDSLTNYDIQLVSEILAQKGLITAATVAITLLSKLHKFDRGFEYFMDYSRITSMPKIGSEKINTIKILRALLKTIQMHSLSKSDSRTNIEVRELMNQIENRNFFLFIHYSDAHHKLRSKNWSSDIEAKQKNEDKSKKQATRELFMKRQSQCDKSIADLVNIMKSKGVFEKTLFIITSDHGEALYEHVLHPNPSQRPDLPLSEDGTYKGHGFSLYDEEILVPLIFSHSSLEPREIPNLVRSIDIVPTILDIFGVENQKHMDGKSLYPILFSKEDYKIDGRIGYAETSPLADNLKCLRDDNWKFIWSKFGRHELYNIKKDPGENDNRFETEKKISDFFEEKLGEFLQGYPEPYFSLEKLDESVKQDLRELGYLK